MTIRLAILEKLGLYQLLSHDHDRFERLAGRCNKIESVLFSAGYFELSRYGRLTPQFEVGQYRLDFALEAPTFKLAIEIDGHDSHKTKDQRQADYQRERNLKRLGWRFIRFTGSDVYLDVQKCVKETIGIIRGIR